jgi:hypothetical protein
LEDWLAKALECFPELESDFGLIQDLSPMSVWIELGLALGEAYAAQPINEDMIGRIYDYAAWCLAQPQTEDALTDLPTAVAVCLIEHLPLNKRVAEDLHRWMSVESFKGFESLFRYHLSDEAYDPFRDEFMCKKRTYSRPSRV